MKTTKKMFTWRLEEAHHEALRDVAKIMNRNKGLKFPIATAQQLAAIELIEFNTGERFLGFSKAEASDFIKSITS